jgi:hypothetical protein
MRRRLAAGAVLALLAAACGREPEQQPAPSDPTAAAPAEAAMTTMPPALRGRWGAGPGDCTAAPGATDGLLDIGETELRYHESRVRLGEVAEAGPRRIVADFVYQGEGETRTHREAFELLDNGLLVRRDAGGAPRTESFTYRRCEG